MENLSRNEDDDDDYIGLISYLSNIFEKNKRVKSLQGTLEKVTKKLQSIILVRLTKEEPQMREKELIKDFDNEFN